MKNLFNLSICIMVATQLSARRPFPDDSVVCDKSTQYTSAGRVHEYTKTIHDYDSTGKIISELGQKKGGTNLADWVNDWQVIHTYSGGRLLNDLWQEWNRLGKHTIKKLHL